MAKFGYEFEDEMKTRLSKNMIGDLEGFERDESAGEVLKAIERRKILANTKILDFR